MTDRELLEAAAKAAGVDLYAVWGPSGHFEGFRAGSLNGDAWNPLLDDGDALRLAVALRLWVAADLSGCTFVADDPDEAGKVSVIERHNGDPMAATRRAITRAAATLSGDAGGGR